MELDGLRVVHAGLDETSAELMGVVDAIDARLRSLERELQPLSTSWVGNAQQAYVLAKGRWDTAVAEMREHLRHTSVQVSRSNDEYRAADVRGARAFEL
jgi:WXG100 family type VII secretion target